MHCRRHYVRGRRGVVLSCGLPASNGEAMPTFERIILTAFVSFSLLVTACTQATDLEQEKKNVQQVLENYLQSIKTADLTLASQVWLQSPDVSAVTPLGRFQ